MSIARSCFLGFAFPVLLLLIVGSIAYSKAKEFTITDASLSFETIKRKIARNLSDSPYAQNSSEVPVLMYHFIRDGVSPEDDSLGYNLSVPSAEFGEQMQYLADNGFTTINFEDFLSGRYPDKSIVLTFDDGYFDFKEVAWPILEKHKFTATVYIITDKFNDPNHLNKEDVQYLANRGVEIGSHSNSHANLTALSRHDLRQELLGSRQILEKLTGKTVVNFSYPAGKYNNLVVEMLQRAGYETAVTTESGLGSPEELFQLKRVRIKRGLSSHEFASLVD